MGRSIAITIPGDAVGKGRPRFSRASGRAFTPGKTRNAEAFAKMCAADAMGGAPLLEGPVRLIAEVTIGVSDSWSGKRKARALAGAELPAKKPDIDNLVKVWADALNGVVFRDDSQIVELIVRKRYGETPGTVLQVAEIFDAPKSVPVLPEASFQNLEGPFHGSGSVDEAFALFGQSHSRASVSVAQTGLPRLSGASVFPAPFPGSAA